MWAKKAPSMNGLKLKRIKDDFAATRGVGQKLAGGDNHRSLLEGNPPWKGGGIDYEFNASQSSLPSDFRH